MKRDTTAVAVSLGIRRRVKIVSAQIGMTMRDFIESAIFEKLENVNKRDDKK